jgi:hypothetical protein
MEYGWLCEMTKPGELKFARAIPKRAARAERAEQASQRALTPRSNKERPASKGRVHKGRTRN